MDPPWCAVFTALMSTVADTKAGTHPLHWEARGAGTPVLLVPGTPGDGGQFDALAAELWGDHLVIAYDRRGTSRSPQLPAGATTTVGEQADDAAEVLAGVGVGPAVVFGTSNGAAVALELGLRHPHRVAGLLLHEMPLLSVLRDPEPVVSAMGSVIGAAMDSGGPAAALEAFLRFAFGDAIVDGWEPALRDRMLANAEMVFSTELPAFQSYRPEPAALAARSVPCEILVGEDQALPFFMESAEWLAERLGAKVARCCGAHGPQFSCPQALAARIRRFAAGLETR